MPPSDWWHPMWWFPMFPLAFMVICLVVFLFIMVPMMAPKRANMPPASPIAHPMRNPMSPVSHVPRRFNIMISAWLKHMNTAQYQWPSGISTMKTAARIRPVGSLELTGSPSE